MVAELGVRLLLNEMERSHSWLPRGGEVPSESVLEDIIKHSLWTLVTETISQQADIQYSFRRTWL